MHQRSVIQLAACLSLFACTEAPKPNGSAAMTSSMAAATPTPPDYVRAYAATATEEDRQALIDKLPKVTINDNGTPRTRYVFEGDMLLTYAEVNALLARRSLEPAGTATPELRVMTDNSGRPAYWPRNARNLTYWIDEASFPAGGAGPVVTALAIASHDWVTACGTCGLQIGRTSNATTATFRVEYQPAAVPYVAASFFPNDPPYRRVLYVARDFYGGGLPQAGVLRHELGHVLGYRHEHIVGIPGCHLEDNRWKELTPYDATSVMHYFCGGGGTFEMRLSDSDIKGHRQLYGQ